MKIAHIAVLTGGDVAEREISIKSAKTVLNNLDPARYRGRLIDLRGGVFYDMETGIVVDKNDFSLSVNGDRLTFDKVYLCVHGHPAEDGNIQGYFQLLGIPFTGCSAFISALTFDKQACKRYLHGSAHLAKSVLIRHEQYRSELEALTYPLFVKPNKNGSSYGVTKVKAQVDLAEAIAKAAQFDDEVLVEEFIAGREFSNGVLEVNGELVALPVTEICPAGEFFDYAAKYNHAGEEITPARLSPMLTAACQEESKKLYRELNCSGLVRFDYILNEDQFYFLEVNTIPGMAPTSIVPQQAVAHGWTLQQLFTAILD